MHARCIPTDAVLPGQTDAPQTTPIATLRPGERFAHHGLIYTVEKTDLSANRYDLTCTYNRRAMQGHGR